MMGRTIFFEIMCVCVCVCACACVPACVCACVRACMCGLACAFMSGSEHRAKEVAEIKTTYKYQNNNIGLLSSKIKTEIQRKF